MENYVKERIYQGHSLESYNTFRVNCKAHTFVEFENTSDLDEYFKNKFYGEPYMVLGGGSNILFTKDYPGTIFHCTNSKVHFYNDGRVKAHAGKNWDKFVSDCVSQGLVGLGSLSLIPGSVGAAPVQNIGAYGSEVSEYITEVECYDPKSRTIVSLKNEDCNFGYRTSIFKQRKDLIIVSVSFKLFMSNSSRYTFRKGKNLGFLKRLKFICDLICLLSRSIRFGRKTSWKLKLNFNNVRSILDLPIFPEGLRRKIVVAIRKRSMPDPQKIPNVGCFFKSPVLNKEDNIIKHLHSKITIYPNSQNSVKVSAGDLIKFSGAHKIHSDNVSIDTSRPLIITSNGLASGYEIKKVAMSVAKKVLDETKLVIEPEVVII